MAKPATATLALGCFWGPDAYFSKLKGVREVVAGYSGGTTSSPTYENLGDHTETVQISFDPEEISYAELLGHFWSLHDPTLKQKVQYQSIIFYHDEEQRAAAAPSLEAEQSNYQRPIVTELREYSDFTRAEEYHQKYYQKHGG